MLGEDLAVSGQWWDSVILEGYSGQTVPVKSRIVFWCLLRVEQSYVIYKLLPGFFQVGFIEKGL